MILYDKTEREFRTEGLGNLPDAISAFVTEERNGIFELEMTYPLKGELFEELKQERIIFAKTNPYDEGQPFRIYKISKPLNGKCTIFAEHISYDLNKKTVSPYNAENISSALQGFVSHCVTPCGFTFGTDKSTTASFKVKVPTAIKTLLGGVEGSILDVFGGGEYKFDKFNVYLYQNRGHDRGVEIIYGKNLTDLKQDEICSNMFTDVYPYWHSEQDDVEKTVELNPKLVHVVDGALTKVYPLDLSGAFDEEPTTAQLKQECDKYIAEHNMETPKISIDVSFVDVSENEELQALERVELCDMVSVVFPALGVDATAKVVSTKFDVLKDRYDSISIGDAKTSFVDSVIETQNEIATKPSKSFLEQAIDSASNLLSGVLGGHFIVWNNQTRKPENPNEWIISQYAPDDTQHNYLTEGHVWRFNLAGWGHSSTGYNGRFETAATLDGGFVADFITSGTIQAINIFGSLIEGSIIKGTKIYEKGRANNGYQRTQIVNGTLKTYYSPTEFQDMTSGGTPAVEVGCFPAGSGNSIGGSVAIKTPSGNSAINLQNYYRPGVDKHGGTIILSEEGALYPTTKLSPDSVTLINDENGNQIDMQNGAIDVWDRTHGFGKSMTQIERGKIVLKGSDGSWNIWLNGETGNVSCISVTEMSSKNYKTNIKDLEDSVLDKVKALSPKTFKYKKEICSDESEHIGFIAEEMEEILPTIVKKNDAGEPEAINYTELIPVLVKAIQELEERVAELERKEA